MTEVTRLLNRLEGNDGPVSDELLPLVYDELRRLAARMMQEERDSHTLTPTALVHEAYFRLVGAEAADHVYGSHSHFFSAAARAMRRVLIDSARRRKAQKRGGGQAVFSLEEDLIVDGKVGSDIEALDEALTALSEQHPDLGELVSLRYFAGMTMPQAAAVMGISRRTADRNWRFARAWLRSSLSDYPP